MQKSKSLDAIRYFDIITVVIALVVAIACILTATGQVWPKHTWNYKDSVGLVVFLLTATAFIFLRREAYARKPWLLLCFCAVVLVLMVILLRRWNTTWVTICSTLLLFGLLMRSKTISSERISREDVLALLLVALSILFTFTLIEGMLRLLPGVLTEGARLRVYGRGGEEPWHVPHPYIGYLHIADAATRARTARPGVESADIDVWGFRNKWPWPEQSEIIAVGDSFTYGQMVADDQAWMTIVAQALPHSRVLNLGLIGAAPQQYLRIYETFGIGLKPKVLLVGLFLGNDLWDAKNFDRWWASEEKGDFFYFGRPETKPGLRGWLARVARRSYVIALLRDLRDSYQSGRLLRGRTVQLAEGGRVQLAPSELSKWAKGGRPGSEAFHLVLETLERIQELAKENRTHIIVLFFPMKEEVYLPLIEKDVPDLAAPFIPELAKRGISYIDLGPYFRERAAKGEALFWEVDGHPNAQGYALIAEVVLSHLKANAGRYGLKRL